MLLAVVKWLAVGVVGLWLLGALMLVAMKWIDPPTTAVHMERRLEAWVRGKPYHERYKFIPLSEISPDFQHAVIAAEDARFYTHHGFDWQAIEIDAEGDMEGGRIRGGSTITQQLVKNLFFGTGRSILRKGAETMLVPVAEFVLGKQRILEILSERGGVGPGNLWRGCGESRLLRNGGQEYRQGRGVTAGCDFAGSAEAATGSDGPIQRADPGANAPNGLVMAGGILWEMRAGIELGEACRGRRWRGPGVRAGWVC